MVNKVAESLKGLATESLNKTISEMVTRIDTAAKRFDPLALVLAAGTRTRADCDHDDGP